MCHDPIVYRKGNICESPETGTAADSVVFASYIAVLYQIKLYSCFARHHLFLSCPKFLIGHPGILKRLGSRSTNCGNDELEEEFFLQQ
jgi:hypothetical protein